MTRRLAGRALLAAVLLLGASDGAAFHAELLASDPANGAHLAAPPSRIRLLFSEPVDIALARLTLLGIGGDRPLPRAVADPRDVNALIVPLDTTGRGAIRAGTQRVRWHVVSLDGHPVEGNITFTVGAGEDPVARADTVPEDDATVDASVSSAEWTAGLVRGTALGLLMLLTGLLAFGLDRAIGAGDVASGVEKRVRILALIVPLVLTIQLALWVVRAVPSGDLGNEAIGTALASGAARVELWRLGFALLAAWALVLARRPALALAFVVGAVALSGAIGHARAVQPWISVPAKAVHLLAGSAWIGGVACLLAHLRSDPTTVMRVASRVSRVALVAVVIVVATGTTQSLLLLSSPWDVVRTSYGLLLLAKLVGTLVLAGLGAYHRLRSLPALQRDGELTPLHTALRFELLVMVAVLLLGGVLSSTEPPAGALADVASIHLAP